MRSNFPVDVSTGTANVGGTLQVLLPYADMARLAVSWCFWVSNDGPGTVNVRFRASPDGVNPDGENYDTLTAGPGMAAMLHRDREMRRFWSMEAYTTDGSTCAVRFGVTVSFEG